MQSNTSTSSKPVLRLLTESFADRPETDKALMVIMFNMVLYAMFFTLALISYLLPGQFSPGRPAGELAVCGICLLAMVTMAISLGWTLRVRQRDPESPRPGIVQIYLIGLPLMGLAVLNGVPMPVTGLMLSNFPMMGVVLFNSAARHVLIATVMYWVEIIALGIAVSQGLLPNAPLFVEGIGNGSFSLPWFLIQVFIGLPAILGGIFITLLVLQGFRTREATILELSRRDGLTGVWNRRYLGEMLEHELAVARRSGSPLAVIMIDVDHFKRVNDEHGHAAGDKALVMVADALRQTIRETDYVGRFGGEEFVIVLPACDRELAMMIAERCRTVIAERRIALRGDPPTLQVTASLGVSSLAPGPGGGPAHSDSAVLLGLADKAMYSAKSGGRNQVVYMAAG